MFFPLWDINKARRFPWLTWLLILANIGVFIHEVRLGEEIQGFVASFGLVPGEVGRGITLDRHLPRTQLLPWFSHMFLHGGLAHLAGNLWFLHIFGDNVEDRVGPFRYLVLYLGAGLVAALTQVVSSPDAMIPMVGASGAISGVLGAYVLYYPMARIKTLMIILPVSIPAFLFILPWFALQVAHGYGWLGDPASQSIAWWAHIGGFVGGAVLAMLLKSNATPR